MWTPRTTPVAEGTQPYQWGIPSVFQCTWFCYFRCQEAMSCTPPTYFDRTTRTGSYPNAKEWLLNYREPWEVKDPDYVPVAGDILVYDGEYGHVIFCETDILTSEYRNGDPNSFRNAKVGDYNGTLLGVLHYPYSPVNTVERNPEVNQIETTDESLRIRTKPSLEGEIVGHVQLGYYNVLQSKEADGYTWYEIAKDRWCANITTKYLPKNSEDFVKEFEEFLSRTKKEISDLRGEKEQLVEDMHSISRICNKYASDTL